jgi:hypothetical protein
LDYSSKQADKKKELLQEFDELQNDYQLWYKYLTKYMG